MRVVLSALALFLVLACSDTEEPPTTITAADSADQIGYNLVHNITIDGVRRVQLRADTAYFFQRTQNAHMYGVTVEFYSEQGALTSTITSHEGTYNWRSQDMEANGNVVAVTPTGRRLTTEILSYNRNRGEISGPEPFVFDAPDRHLEGDAFTSDPDFTQVEAVRPRRGRIGGATR